MLVGDLGDFPRALDRPKEIRRLDHDRGGRVVRVVQSGIKLAEIDLA